MTEEELRARYNATLPKTNAKKNNQISQDDLRARWEQTRPIEVQQQEAQQAYNTAVVQAGQRHGQLAQQGQRNLAQKQAVIYSPQQQQRNNVQDFKTVLENYSKENNRLPTDPKELKALAEANGLYSGENKYQTDKLQATQGKNPVLNNEIRTSQLGSGTIKKDEAFDKSYGKREGQEEFKSLDFTSNNNSDKYEKYKQNLEIAKENKDTRNIAKYTSLLEEYKKKYKELYGNTKLETKQLPGLRRTIEQEQNDLNELSKQYLNATTPQEKNNIAVQFNRVDENLKNHTKAYQDTIAWDEIVNKNIAVDSMKSLGKNVTGGTANILNAGYTLGTKLIGDDATTINANALLNYTRPRNAVSNTIQNIASVAGSAMNPLSTITGINESPDMAYLHLTRLRATHPENQRLANLYNEITNKTYKGTAEDLKNELDTIQKELYQYAKDNILRTQDELDAVADQVRHNETYGSLSMIPNAFGTVGNMIPSMIAGAGIGEVGSMAMLGLNAGSSSMDQALQSGAGYNQALNYGILSGGTEVATEKMFDTGANKLLGIKGGLDTKGLANRVIDGLGIKSKVGKVIANTASDVGGEMVEEMVAEAVNPLWKALSYEGLEALPQNGEELGQYIKDIINAGVEAIPSTLLMQGGGAVLNTYKTQQLENGLIKSINESDLSQIVKNQLINEVRKASTDVKLGLEESDYIQDKAYEKGFNLAAQSEQMKQRIPQGYTLPQSTLDILSFVENNRPGLTIAFNANAQGNGTFIENPDGTRTITLNPNSQRAVEFTLTHELGHDLKGTQEYTQLQNLLEDYAKGKPKYQESLDALNKTYQNSNANYNLKDEATNDMLGQAIGEQEFYNKLAENPTLFNKVTNELKNLLGNKDTKLKNKIEKLTRNAYQSVHKGTGNNRVLNSLSSAVDSQGKQLTQGQLSYFKNQAKEGLDKNGNLLRLYHGTPNGNFTVFKDGTYLTPNKNYADRYQSTSASSLANSGKEALNPKTFEVYAKIEKPFTLTDKTARDIYINEYIKGGNALGINPYESDNFYNQIETIDWTEGEDLREWLKENYPEYDSIILDEGADIGYDGEMYDGKLEDRGDSILVFNSNQIKDINNANPTDNPDIRYSKQNGQWQQFLDKNFNWRPNGTKTNFTKTDTTMLPSNEELIKNVTKSVENEPIVAESLQNNAKNKTNLEDIVDLKPEDAKLNEMRYKQLKDKNTPNQRKFFDNLETSQLLDEETKNRINATAYEQRHNMDVLQAMSDKLDERGNKLVEEWKMKQKNFTDKDIALGAILIERYQQDGDWDSAARAAEKLADMSTESGRALQMYSIFQRLSPETMQIFAQKQLNEAFEEMKKRQTGKWVEKNKDKFKLTAEESKFIYDQVEKASQAIDEETKQRELSKVEKMINQKLPPEKGQTIRALRRIAMLFNPKTQVRNFVGNSLIIPVNDAADVIGTAIDKALAKKTGVRTTSLPRPVTKLKGGIKGLQQAVKDYRTGTRTESTGNRFEFEIGAKAFNENTDSPLRNKIAHKLNSANELLSAIMSGGDRPFYEAAYQNSLKGQMRANKVDTPTPEMEEIARNEGMQRTWNDDNEYTKTVLDIRRAMNKINVNGFGLGDLVIPFAKTPANLTKAMVEYSPAGFIESVIDYNDMRKAISRGEMTPMQQKKFVTSMSKAITGTMLYLIAGTLVKAGKLTGSADDDKDVKNFEQNVMGIQPYSVRIGDKTYTYSWANPINAPLAVMADTYKMNKENASTAEILNNAFKVAGSVLVENSFLSGVKDLFNDGNISEGLVNAVTSMPSSFIPTFISQLASLGDSKQRQTFEYNDTAQTEINKIKNKLPGARNTLEPQVNTFGEEIENQNNVFNAFLNPANVREARVTESQKALYDVYQETKDKTIFPMQAPYYTNTDAGEKKNLSSKERVAYQKASGQYVTEVYDDLFNNEAFNNSYHMNNEAKTTILKKIAEDGNAKGREAVGAISSDTNSNLDKLNERNEILNNAGIPLADYYIAWYSQKNVSKKQAKRTAISQQLGNELDKEQKEVLYGIFNVD